MELRRWISGIGDSLLSQWAERDPWVITSAAEEIVAFIAGTLGEGHRLGGGLAIHKTAIVEDGAVIKPPAVIGPRCFVSARSYLRGGVFLDEHCIVGPFCELKSSFMFKASKIAHLSFVGDSLIGAGANIEAGAMIANYRNERSDKRIRIAFDGEVIDTGVEKFGALVGDGARIGANAVIAPGAILAPRSVTPRLTLVDQSGD